MKNEYVKPEMNFEEFSSNSYVAACGQTVDGDYLFACDGPSGTIYIDSNGMSGLQTEKIYGPLTCTNTSRKHTHTDNCYQSVTPADQRLGGVHACDVTHKTSNINDFVDGYYVDGTKCIIYLEFGQNKYGTWNGKGIKNYHSSTSLTREQLTVVKS